MNRSLHGTVVPRLSVSKGLEDELFALFRRYYGCVSRADFERDLAEKDWVLLLRDTRGVVRGFTTMRLLEIEHRGRRTRALFNGNTIIDQGYWGDQELVRTWCTFMAGLEREDSDAKLYWFLICSGYRTYLFLPLFFHDYAPLWGAATTEHDRSLIDHLGRLGFPDDYRDGIIHPPTPRECLREELARPDQRRLANRHVRYFVEANPGYLRGDELVCIAEFSLENTKRAAHEALARTRGVPC